MPDLKPRHLESIRAGSATMQQVGECLQDIVASHNNVAQQVNASPVGQTPSPTGHAGLQVAGGSGYFSAQITDNSPAFRGKENMLEVSEDKNFPSGQVHLIHLGPSQSWYGNLGPKMLHFRSYPVYPTSGPAQPIYAYNVDGSGASAPKITGNASAVGYGAEPFNTPQVPKR